MIDLEEIRKSMDLANLDYGFLDRERFNSYILSTLNETIAEIELLRATLLDDRTRLILYSPYYIVWRYHNIDDLPEMDGENGQQWDTAKVEARRELEVEKLLLKED